MDRFLKRPAPGPAVSPSRNKMPKISDKQGSKSAAFRAKEFGTNFYESGGRLFYRPCNTVVGSGPDPGTYHGIRARLISSVSECLIMM